MNKQEFASAYTGLQRADLMFFGWDETCRTIDIANSGNELLMRQPTTYLLLADALLFVVLEFLKSKDAIPPSIVDDVDLVYDKLRLTRNGIFHIQDEYLDKKTTSLADLPVASISKIRQIHKFLMEYFENPNILQVFEKASPSSIYSPLPSSPMNYGLA